MDITKQPIPADIEKAVKEASYLVNVENSKPNGGNREIVAAARNILKALTGSNRVPSRYKDEH